ncbi:hypothetical protein JTB14_019019 [Gonioctena quinquepunctata]|nr:hypothetical protein JTB14_019019 [Gonioctena quinquepunctata]
MQSSIGEAEATKRLLAQLPISAQSYSCSPYLDLSLFSYDEKWVSVMERPKACGEHPIRFYARDSGFLKFRICAGVIRTSLPTVKKNTYRRKRGDLRYKINSPRRCLGQLGPPLQPPYPQRWQHRCKRHCFQLYSPEQWAQAQQQNWQQWAQWQQQYQQWHQQYGAEYQKSMSAMQGGALPPLAQPTLPNVQPPLPAAMAAAVAPPLPVENKPPLPPEEPPIAPISMVSSYSTAPPKLAQTGYPNAPPLMSQQILPPQMAQVPPAPTQTNQQNWQTQKRPYSQENEYSDPKRAMKDRAGGHWGQQRQASQWSGTNQNYSQPPPQAQVAPPPPAKANVEELSEAEKKFDKEFAAWEAQFNKWKEQNANHPDKTQYREYEKKWESWRNSLLERREQMRRKRLALTGQTAAAVIKPQSFTQPPPVNQLTAAGQPQPLISQQPPVDQPQTVPKPSLLGPGPIAYNTSTPKATDQFFSKPPPNQNNEPLTFKNTSFPPEDSENAGSDFLKPTSSSGGIPGLDLVPGEGNEDENSADNVQGEAATKEEAPPPSAVPQGPDFDAISKAAAGKNITTDSMSTMPPGYDHGRQNFSEPPPMQMPPQGGNFNVPPPINDGPQGNLPFNEQSNQSFEDRSYKEDYGQQREIVNNFDDQTRSSFTMGPNDHDQGFRNNRGLGGRLGAPPVDNRSNFGPGGPRNAPDNFDRGFGKDGFSQSPGNFENRGNNFNRNNRFEDDNFQGDSFRNNRYGGHNKFDEPRGNFGGSGGNFGRQGSGENFNRQDNEFGRDNKFARSGSFNSYDDHENYDDDDYDSYHQKFADEEDHYQDEQYHRQDNQRLPPLEQRPPPLAQRPPPLAQRLPPLAQRLPLLEQRPPPMEQQRLPPIEQRPPPMEQRPPLMEQRLPPMEQRPPPMQQRPPPMEQRLPPMEQMPPQKQHKIPGLMDQLAPAPPQSQKKVDSDVAIEPINMVDYRHKPVNRIPLPERPKWLSEAIKFIREFDPLAARYERPPPPREDNRLSRGISFEDREFAGVRNARPFERDEFQRNRVDLQRDRGDFHRDRGDFHRDRGDFPRDMDDFSRNRDDFSRNREDVPHNRDDFSRNRDDFPRNRDDFSRNRDDFSNNKDDFSRNKDDFSRNKDDFSHIKDDFSRDRDDFRRDRGHRDDFHRDDKNRGNDRGRQSFEEDKLSKGNKEGGRRNSGQRHEKQDLEELSDEDMDWEQGEQRRRQQEQVVKKSRSKSPELSNPPNPSNNATEITMIEDVVDPPGRLNRPPRVVIILRGPPGSGKTFLAKQIKDKEVENGGSAPRILSLDDYFMVEHEKQVMEDGKMQTVKEMVYEYESEMEESYRTSLMKSFKKTITDGYFAFVIVDNINDKVKHFGEMWSYAKQNGFQVYICQLDLDPVVCIKRNIHNRTESEIEECISGWEPTPSHHPTIDASSFLQAGGAITEVEMELEDQQQPEQQSDQEKPIQQPPEKEKKEVAEPSSMESTNPSENRTPWKSTSNWNPNGNPRNHPNRGRRGFGGPIWRNRGNRRR